MNGYNKYSIRRRSGRLVSCGMLMLAVFVFSACTTTTTQNFRIVKGAQVESSYVSTDADFSQYNQLLGKEMGIYFPTSMPHSDEEIARIRSIFRETFFAELEDYTIVTEAGPTTMTVEASLIDMRYGSSTDVPSLRGDLSSLARPGQLVFLMELRDSQSDRVLARAADSAGAPPAFATPESNDTDWKSVEDAALRWATLFREFLNQNFSD